MLGKQIGIIRHVDELGRFVVPKEITNNLNWGGRFFSFKTDENIIIATALPLGESGRKLDQLNRLVVPKWLRKKWGIVEGTLLEMYFYENGIKLTVWEGLNK